MRRHGAVLKLVGNQLRVPTVVFNDENPQVSVSSTMSVFKTLSHQHERFS
jgi:hypothetical protein